MQGTKEIVPKMMYQVHIDKLVPQHNFYRLLEKALDLRFLYQAAEKYYGVEGQESIDPVVFFKVCLVGYLNNINSDRRFIEYCSDSLAIRLYLRYEDMFLTLFRKVLSLCVEKGLVSGKRQAVDSVFIKANASIDNLVEKEVLGDAAAYADELNQSSE